MRQLQADVAVEPLKAAGGIRLRIKTKAGEEFSVELPPAKAAALREAIPVMPAPVPVVAEPIVEAPSSETVAETQEPAPPAPPADPQTT